MDYQNKLTPYIIFYCIFIVKRFKREIQIYEEQWVKQLEDLEVPEDTEIVIRQNIQYL